MPVEPNRRPGLQMEGALHISCGDFGFSIELTPRRVIADFPSFGALLQARKEGGQLKTAIDRLPPLPGAASIPAKPPGGGLTDALSDMEIFVAVNSRPVGKITSELGTLRFRPTPLQFFKRLR